MKAIPIHLDIKKERTRCNSPSEKTHSSVQNSKNTSTTVISRNKSENKKSCSAESDTFHPLMQLQKLLDKTDSGKTKNNSQNVNSNSVGISPSLLAFSWACNEATTSMAQSSTPMSEEKHHKSEHSIKCPYCDASFNSKGAFRHHFSKTHLKADKAFDLVNTTPPNSNSNNNNHNNENISKESGSGGGPVTSSNSETSITANESPHSKFLKYTELAKQLSSKYV